MCTADILAVDINFLNDTIVKLSKAERGTVFVVDDITQELYFMTDRLSGGTQAGRISIAPPS